MKLLCFSLSHETCALEERQRFALKSHDSARLCRAFLNAGAREALTVSTCNRVEIYAVAAQKTELDCRALWADFFSAPHNSINGKLYHDAKALEHLFGLACGTRSLVVGETEILGQLKQAYAGAFAENTTGKILNRSFQRAFSLAKQIRTGTEIGRYRVSVASAAASEIDKILGDKTGVKIAVWGGGTVGLAVCNSFTALGRSGTMLVREPHKYPQLAGQWKIDNSEHYRDYLRDCEVFVSCTGAPHPVIHPQDVPVRESKLLLFDLAVPRDTAPALKNRSDILLYDMDDLARVVTGHKAARDCARMEIEPRLNQEAQKFWRCLNASLHEQCLADWRVGAHEFLEKELEDLSASWPDMPPEVREKLHQLAGKLMHRLLHWPSHSIRQAVREGLPCADFFTVYDEPEEAENAGYTEDHEVNNLSSQK